MKRAHLLWMAILLLEVTPAAAQVGTPVNRWGLDYSRPTRIPRANDVYVRRAPVRANPKVKRTPKAHIQPLPKYGKPKPAIERIPPT